VSGRRVIGIDAGGTKVLGGVVDDGLTVHHRVHRLWHGADRQAVLDLLVTVAEEAIEAAPDADAIGFGIPALLDRERVRSLACVHLSLEDVPVRDLVSERVDRRVMLDNDANCALLAEARAGAAEGAADALLLTLGTGIGGAILSGGQIHRGTGGAGELGHVTVDSRGPLCSCGNRGCVEAYASGTALADAGVAAAKAEPNSALGRALGEGRTITAPLVTELAAADDPAATQVLEEAGRQLGVGLASLANAFSPEVIVIGGGAAAAGDLLLGPARDELRRRALRPNRDVPVAPAHFGPEAGMIGAAVMAMEEGQ
jgi:glucokinase